MAEGFRRAGITFDLVFDYDPDACDSYEKNLEQRPVRMDVRDLVRMARLGWTLEVGLLVADPPCTPWSRAGKRLGTEDERDMLEETADLVRLLRPQAYLIGNVPGLQDSTAWHVVQRVIGGLQKDGYCVADYVCLDAADYGVPQHRIRPFWYGHREGTCVRWPLPTHGDGSHPSLPGLDLLPWVTCRAALSHLPVEQLGRPVRLKKREANEHGRSWDNHPVSKLDSPSFAVKCNGGRASGAASTLLVNDRHEPADPDAPAGTIGAKYRGQHEVLNGWPWDRPATTVLADERLALPGHHSEEGSFLSSPDVVGTRKKRPPSTKGAQWERRADPDAPSPAVLTGTDRIGGNGPRCEWPWDRPSTTVCSAIDKIAPANEHQGQFGPNAVVLSERAAAILQGFPTGWVFSGATKKARWAQIGMPMPPPLAEAVARSIRRQLEATGFTRGEVGEQGGAA